MDDLKKGPPPIPATALKAPPASARPGGPPPVPASAMPSPWDSEVVASAPKPTAPATGSTWMNNASYPLIKPQHAGGLEQEAAVNEFALKMPRAKAEAEAYGAYTKRNRIEASAHHLAGMKAAHAAGDMESARKHSVMYNLHSKALGHEPVGPAHPSVVAHMEKAPAKVYKFKPHGGDAFALNDHAKDAASGSSGAGGVVSSAPGPMLGKAEDALHVLWKGCQALLKGAVVGSIPGPIQPKQKGVKGFHDIGIAGAKKWARGQGIEPHPDAPKVGDGFKDPKEPAKKAELSATKSKVKPCVCPSYSFPHRHKSGKCGK